MSAVSGSSAARVVTAFAVVGLLLAAAHEAEAKQRARKHIFDDLMTPSMITEAARPQPAAATTGPQFFTIAGVLAKLDGKPNAEPALRIANASSDTVVSDAPAAIGYGTAASQEPFGLLSFRAPEGVLWRKWRELGREIEKDTTALAACRSDRDHCSEAAARLQAMIDQVQAAHGRARIEIANRLINGAVGYTSDLAQHGQLDHWSAPLATIDSGRGDCEDYAIAKYVALREAGFAETDLRILLGKDRSARQDHAVLAVRSEGTWFVLDNRWNTLKREAESAPFVALYALDRGGVSLFASPYLSDVARDPAGIAPASADAATSWSGADMASLWDAATAPASLGAHEPASPFLL